MRRLTLRIRSCLRRLQRVRVRGMSCIARLYLKFHGVVVGYNLQMCSLPLCRRHPGAAIVIGNHVSIANRLKENLAGLVHRTVLVANEPGARLVIGNHVGISGAVLFCSREIVIEDYVNIGVAVRIYDTDFHPIEATERRMNRKESIKTASVHLCEDVWIGANAIILKGVTIGPRSIVAAGSVVSRDIPPDTIAAGVPARPVCSLVST